MELTASFRIENLTTFEVTKISYVDCYGVCGGDGLFFQHDCVKLKFLLAPHKPFWADCLPDSSSCATDSVKASGPGLVPFPEHEGKSILMPLVLAGGVWLPQCCPH